MIWISFDALNSFSFFADLNVRRIEVAPLRTSEISIPRMDVGNKSLLSSNVLKQSSTDEDKQSRLT